MFLGIEIGGTKLQIGIGPGDGTLAGLWRGSVDVAGGGEGIRRQITTALPELLERSGIAHSDLNGVGIGFGGPVDDATRTVIKSHQIEGWDTFPLADWVSELLGLPSALGNDADVAGLAEALFGAGKGLSPIFYITIGSGIGGGLITNGEIYRGCGRGAAEIGHTRLVPSAALQFSDQPITYFCWPKEASRLLEELASGWAIAFRGQEAAALGDPRALTLLRLANGQAERITAAHVAQAAAQGDELAWSILTPAWACLGYAIGQVIALLSPRRIVIGGGVSLMGEQILFEPVRRIVAAQVFKPFANCYDIVPAALGEEVVVHGALALARRRLSPNT
jgi:glucokinase